MQPLVSSPSPSLAIVDAIPLHQWFGRSTYSFIDGYSLLGVIRFVLRSCRLPLLRSQRNTRG